MILGVVVLVTTVSVSYPGNPLDKMHNWAMKRFVRSVEKEKFLSQLVRRTYFLKFSIIAGEFLGLNLLGVFLARIFVRLSGEETQQWTWMTTFYWAVQTTTTIGVSTISKKTASVAFEACPLIHPCFDSPQPSVWRSRYALRYEMRADHLPDVFNILCGRLLGSTRVTVEGNRRGSSPIRLGSS